MRARLRYSLLLVLLMVTVGLTLVCGVTSTWWIDATFPGFFVMDNRVIASISLPHWPVASRPQLYQQAIVAVNGQTVSTTSDLYGQVQSLPAGAPVTYTLEQHGKRTDITLPTAQFTAKDWNLLFGAYLVNGVALALIGIAAWYWSPGSATGSALLSLGLTMALFLVTAADLYAPHWFFRLHILGEAFFPAAAVHLALVFPHGRLDRRRVLFLALPYAVGGLLGLSYEVFLYVPTAYTLIHNLCTWYAGLAGCGLIGKMLWDYGSMAMTDLRRKIRVVALGSLMGYGFPTVLMLLASLNGGQLALNYAAFTLFVFPLSIAYVLVKQDLLQIERLLRQGVSALAGLALVAFCLGGGQSDTSIALAHEEHATQEGRHGAAAALPAERSELPDPFFISTHMRNETVQHSADRDRKSTRSLPVLSGSSRLKNPGAPDTAFRVSLATFDSTNLRLHRSFFLSANTAMR